MSEELKKLREAAEKRGALIDPIKWASRPQLFDLSYLHPSGFYLDKKTEPTGEVSVTHYTGRYSELPAIGRFERRLKEVETKVSNIGRKGEDKYIIT